MNIVKSTILCQSPARGGLRVVFQHELDDGCVLGPFVEQRPAKEDVEAYVAADAQTRMDSPVVVQATKADELLAAVLAYDDETIKTALTLDDKQLVDLKTKMSVELVEDLEVEPFVIEGRAWSK